MSIRPAVANGLHRGLIELHQTVRSAREYLPHVLNVALFAAVAAWRGGTVEGTETPASTMVLVGEVATVIVSSAWTTLPQIMATERQDGTLLRLRSVPFATTAYVVSKTLYTAVIAIASALVLLLVGAGVNGAGLPHSADGWITLAWVLLLGLVAVVPIGTAIGASLPNARAAMALLVLPVYALMAVSGVFFPVTGMPRWLQLTAEVFPLKWLAQGLRSATMPDTALVAETGHSWQHWQTATVLTAWAVAGFVIAPAVLRRTSRRVSGTRITATRQPSDSSVQEISR
ncbi:ABC transporter permease [Kitasatospora sp. NPDC018058]|uniref:ABC transporter permease n=1 Tax=Kitasatospora sp. NPDC018058 TaxID=3364025 RepID=UPI0037C10BAD